MKGKERDFCSLTANRFAGAAPLSFITKERPMLYRKNIYAWEQWSRVLLGVALVALGFLGPPGGWIGWIIALAGAGLAVTGIFGWCPACAMIGRRPVE
jgi:hypothetical protein